MTSAPRDRPRVMVSGLKPAPSMPLGTRMPTLSGGPDRSGICRPSWALAGPFWASLQMDSLDERGDTGRNANAHRPRRQRAPRVHGQLHRSDSDAVLVMATEIGGVQDGAGRAAARRAGLGDLDVLRPDRDGPGRTGMMLGYGDAVAELRRAQHRVAVRSRADGAGEEIALPEEFGDEAPSGLPVDLLRRPLTQDAAAVHDQDPVAHRQRLV